MLAEKMEASGASCWLINTGWVGGAYGTGKRCSLKYTRAIIDAIHDGSIHKAEFGTFKTFGLQIPKSLPGVPEEVLNPFLAWSDKGALDGSIAKLATMFTKNFKRFEADAGPEVLAAGPQ